MLKVSKILTGVTLTLSMFQAYTFQQESRIVYVTAYWVLKSAAPAEFWFI